LQGEQDEIGGSVPDFHLVGDQMTVDGLEYLRNQFLLQIEPIAIGDRVDPHIGDQLAMDA
jgi:hypothetical protein